jgi:WD40 repeat protein
MTKRSVYLFDLAAPRTAEPVPLLGDERLGNVGTWFSPDGSWFALGDGRSFVLWNVAGAHSTVVGRQKPPCVLVALAPNGELLSLTCEGALMRWPLSPSDRGGMRELWKSPGEAADFSHIEVDPQGRFVITATRSNDVVVVPLDGSRPSVYHLKKPDSVEILVVYPLSGLDAGGRLLAASLWGWTRHDPNSIRILDLAKGSERILDTHPKGDERCVETGSLYSGVAVPIWLRDGRLVSDGDGGLRVWDVHAGTSELLRPCRLPVRQGKASLEDPGRLLATPDSRTVLRLDAASNTGDISSLTAFDLVSRSTREITSHGNQLLSFALDPSGTGLVTGDRTGLVRVGPLSGEEPHLLFGNAAAVWSVAVSPDGRWIASGSEDGTLRLWPMPDLSKPPLHAWPRDRLLARLRSLTNLRAVRDPSSDTGWKIEVGPFPGWKDVPTW